MLLGAFLASACASQATPTPLEFKGELPADPGPDVGGVALQEEVFADGVVTFDEYERAMTAYAQCIRDEGFEVLGPLRYPEGGIGIEPGIDPTRMLGLRMRADNDPTDRLGRVAEQCESQWAYAIERMYVAQYLPTEQEIQEWLDRAWTCARERGLPLSAPPNEDDATGAVIAGCRPWEANR